MNGIVIHLLNGARNGTGLAFSDGTEVNFAQADALGGCAAHEDFIGNVKLVA